MKEWLENHKTKMLGVIILFIIVIIYFFNHSSEKSDIAIGEASIPQMKEQKKEESGEVNKLNTMMVDVKGAVKGPGVYLAKEGERVIDLINKAGGFTINADQNQVNLAQHIEDEMVIFVPTLGEINESITNSTVKQENSLININKATELELQTLPGIGPSKASAIIEYRETNGGFQSIDDLKKISGIGEKTFEKLSTLIVVK